MKTPTNEQLLKLPVWAKEYIKNLERERNIAINTLNEFCDNQTPSAFYIEELVSTGEEIGVSFKKKYIRGDTLNIEYKGIRLRVSAHDYNGVKGIGLAWNKINNASADIAFIPSSHNRADLVTKENMR